MTMNYMGMLRNSYSMAGFNGPFHGQGFAYNHFTYEQQQLVLAQLQQHHHQQQQQRTAAILSQGTISQSKQTEPKPRLAKDEVEILEREFQKNPKPNSSLKRELAEQMRVDVARINNWFQNRRAKAKQIKKTAEFEAQQGTDMPDSEPKSPEDDDEGVISEYFGNSDQIEPLQPSSAAFNEDDAPDMEESQSYLLGPDEHEQHSVHSIDAADHQSELSLEHGADSLVQDDFTSPPGLEFRPTAPSVVSYDNISDFTPGPLQSAFPAVLGADSDLDDQAETHSLPLSALEEFEASQAHLSTMDSFDRFTVSDVVDHMSTSMPAFLSSFVPEDLSSATHGQGENANAAPTLDHMVKVEQLSPASTTQSPPFPADLRFRSPPPRLDIATRRNIPRPAKLNPTALRNYPYGPRTALEIPKRADGVSPSIRRISSATGPMNGRIHKASLGSAPRSPMFSERNKEAFLQSLQGALSPVTPSDSISGNPQHMREATVSSSASDEDQRYTFGAGPHTYFQVDPSHIKTPPSTPGMHGRFPVNALETPWNFVPSDEPLVTPGLGSFGSELEFPLAPQAPGYVASQPATPGFPSAIGPTYYAAMYSGTGAANLEYKFPDSYAPESSARSSPVGGQSRQFQFTQNITPQDFHQDR